MTLARSGLSLESSYYSLVAPVLYWGPLCSVLDPVLRLGRGRRVTKPNSILLDDEIKNDFLLSSSSFF